MPQASTQLTALEQALTSASLVKDRFVVAGHTDRKGSAEYNKTLSLKRAEAVKKFLVSKGVDAGRLETIGYGSERLLAPDRPEDPSNRRVEIRDIGQASPVQ
jgi:outer membrane protein OmpA-like peptidoglycan-associated protein